MVTAVSNKIDTSNFKFIEVKDQYVLAIAVKTETPNKYINFFSQESDLISYVDVSRVGFELPAVEIVFTFSDRKLLPYLCEKAIFVISIGKDINSQKQSTFNIISAQVNQKAEGKWAARIVGVYNKLDYYKKPIKKVYANTSSEIAKQIFQESLGTAVKMPVDVRSRDHMYWLQQNESNHKFLYGLWLHSYIPDSIWLAAIDFDGTARLTDVRKQAKTIPEITLTTGASNKNSKVYPVLDNFDISDNSGINNNFGGYDQLRPVYDLDTATKNILQKKEAVVLSESDNPNKATNVSSEASYVLQNSNVHTNFHLAPLNNKNMLLNLKTFQLSVTTEGEFVPVNLLQYVMFKDVQSNGQAQEDYSGLYIVGKIAHQIANKKLYTHISLWRESQNTLAEPSISEKIQNINSKIENVQQQIDMSEQPVTLSFYEKYLASLDKLDNEVTGMTDKVSETVNNSSAYSAYQQVKRKHAELIKYVSKAYMVTSDIVSYAAMLTSYIEDLKSVTTDTAKDKLIILANRYLKITETRNRLESRIQGLNQRGVINEFIKVKATAATVENMLIQLKNAGIDLKDSIS